MFCGYSESSLEHWGKEELLDPESADLYLIVMLENMDLTLEECVSMEASEKFCRKFILRPDETIEDLMKRTFLPVIIEDKTTDAVFDPLTVALNDTGKDAEWFSANERDRWRALLLSSKSGHDLVEKLFKFPPDGTSE
jgi:hypothetical protein